MIFTVLTLGGDCAQRLFKGGEVSTLGRTESFTGVLIFLDGDRQKAARQLVHIPPFENSQSSGTFSYKMRLVEKRQHGLGSVARTGERQFHAPVLRLALRRIVRRHWVCIAETLR